jgi:hypothetical protein
MADYHLELMSHLSAVGGGLPLSQAVQDELNAAKHRLKQAELDKMLTPTSTNLLSPQSTISLSPLGVVPLTTQITPTTSNGTPTQATSVIVVSSNGKERKDKGHSRSSSLSEKMKPSVSGGSTATAPLSSTTPTNQSSTSKQNNTTRNVTQNPNSGLPTADLDEFLKAQLKTSALRNFDRTQANQLAVAILYEQTVTRISTVIGRLETFVSKFSFMQCAVELLRGVLHSSEQNLTKAHECWEKAAALAEERGMIHYCAQAHFFMGFYSTIQDRNRRTHLLAARLLFSTCGDLFHTHIVENALCNLSYYDCGFPVRRTLGPSVFQSYDLFMAINEQKMKVQLGEALDTRHQALLQGRRARKKTTDYNRLDLDDDETHVKSPPSAYHSTTTAPSPIPNKSVVPRTTTDSGRFPIPKTNTIASSASSQSGQKPVTTVPMSSANNNSNSFSGSGTRLGVKTNGKNTTKIVNVTSKK